MFERRVLALILVAFMALGTAYALVTPVFEASDELWHYPMIRHLAGGNPLPVQVFDPAQAGPWKQEASQPPLYYYLGAALTFWIDTGDIQEVRRLNPHVDNGVITADGNINLVVHDDALSPWQGTLLAVRIVRLASVLMATVTVYLTYRIARLAAPRRVEVALGAAAVNAFTPMFLFISGAVNNDNLAIMLASLALFMMLRIVRQDRERQPDGVRLGPWIWLGVVIGLAALTKEGTLGLLPMAFGTALIDAWQQRAGAPNSAGGPATAASPHLLATLVRKGLGRFLLTLLPAILIAGWWYYRNVALYGDWLGWNAFIAVLGERPQPATLAQLWDERWGFLASYWGLFGGVNVPMPGWIYATLNTLLPVAVPGFLLYLWRTIRAWWRLRPRSLRAPSAALDALFDFVAANFGLVVCLLFSLAVIYGLVNWATTTWSSQGRLAFTAISTLSTLLAMGLIGWMPPMPARLAAAALATFMFAVAAAAPFLWIAPAYEPRQAAPPEELQPLEINFGEKLALTGYAVEAVSGTDALQPGAAIDVYLRWRVLEEMARDWSVFVHLNDPVLQTPIAQRDMYPGSGLLATSFLEQGATLVEHYRLHVPQTAVAPSTLELVVGLYDFHSQTNERLQSEQGDAVTLAALPVEPARGDAPNATSINFGDALELAGHELQPRVIKAGGRLELVLYYKALQPLDTDYTIFAQLLNGTDTTRWAANDIELQTSDWAPGDVQVVDVPMDLDDGTPPGVYTIVVGAYTRQEDGGFNRLQIVRESRITMDDSLSLTRVRVE